MLTIKTELRQAQKLKEFLVGQKLFDPSYRPDKLNGFIYFPLTDHKADLKKLEKKFGAKLVNRKLEKIETGNSVEELLGDGLTKKEIGLIPSSQERVGSILILEIPKELVKKEKIIAQAFLKANPPIKTVVKKTHSHGGVFRLRKVKVLAGEKTKETIHQENNVKVLIDVEKTYFSSRLGNERLRIAKQIRKPEEILVMFSGAAPYPLVLARNSPAKIIYGVEINPLAHQMALKNVGLNHLEDKIRIFEGDVHLVLPTIKKKFDRILMPLPMTGEKFLPLALKKAKAGTIIHLYSFLDQKELAAEPKKIRKIYQAEKHSVRILRKVKCGQFSPAVARYCFDLKILK